MIVTLQQRRNAAASELEQVGSQLEQIQEVTGDVVRHSEETLSKMYGGREVHILGNVRRIISDRVS